MFDVNTLYKGSGNNFYAVDSDTGETVLIEEMFPMETWDCPEAFKFAGIHGYEPMTAKELETESDQDARFNDPDYIIEEKFDGTRALVHFFSQHTVDINGKYGDDIGYCRVFSRRVSRKTGFYVENTDNLPHLREINIPGLGGTILDGEMLIDGLPFKEVSSTLNCLWDKAVERQLEKGFITFHAFDILFYRGIDLRKFPLHRRKFFLHVVTEELNHPYIKEVEYHYCGRDSTFGYTNDEIIKNMPGKDVSIIGKDIEKYRDVYPNLWECYRDNLKLTPRGYYELLVFAGREGVMVKTKEGRYFHKRGWEYSKIKKFLTRELVVVGFDEPTREYSGKEIKRWAYWQEKSTGKMVMGNFYADTRYDPVTKFYFNKQVGNLLLGVFVHVDDYNKIPESKRGKVYDPDELSLGGSYDVDYVLMQVCECAGFDDETREYFTLHMEEMLGSVVEVKANEIFKDSGKLRHPRYMRRRFDKSAGECTWENHV